MLGKYFILCYIFLYIQIISCNLKDLDWLSSETWCFVELSLSSEFKEKWRNKHLMDNFKCRGGGNRKKRNLGWQCSLVKEEAQTEAEPNTAEIKNKREQTVKWSIWVAINFRFRVVKKN